MSELPDGELFLEKLIRGDAVNRDDHFEAPQRRAGPGVKHGAIGRVASDDHCLDALALEDLFEISVQEFIRFALYDRIVLWGGNFLGDVCRFEFAGYAVDDWDILAARSR